MIAKICNASGRLMLITFLLAYGNLFAQVTTKPVTGKIVNESFLPLSGVSVTVKGARTGTVSDSLGVFQIQAPEKGILVFSLVGYASQELAITNASDYSVTLKENQNKLDEVVVVGYGTAKKRDLTGSIQTINIENSPIATLANTNPLQALSGTVAGIIVNPQSKSGQDPLSTMSIRGENSIDPSGSGLNRPLIVVDDIIFNGTLNQINMQDVATMNVLKDASSAAIYGSRSANGVIIITTKKGKTGKPLFTLNSSYAFQNWSRKPEMQMDIDKLLKVRWDYFIDAGRIPVGTDFNRSLILTAQEMEAYDKGIRTNWLDEITQYAPIQNHNLSVAGNSSNTNYYLSAGVLDHKGVIYNDRFKKVTFLAKLETKINQYLTLGVKGNYYSADNSGLSPSMQSATWMSPLSSPKTLLPGYEDWTPSNPSGSSARNPFVGFDRQVGPAYGSDENKAQNIDGSGWLIVKNPWIKNLTYKVSLNGTYSHNVYNLDVGPKIFADTRNPANMDNFNNFWGQAYATAAATNVRTWILDQILTYTTRIGSHSIDAMAGHSRDAYRYNTLRTEGNGFNMPNPLKWNGINLATTQKVFKGESRYQNLANMFRLNYNYDSKYYFTGTFRRDGFSGFAPGNKYGNFPGASVGWAISQENFMSNVGWVDYLKLRVSWGQTGNQSISPYETLATMGLDRTVYGSNTAIAIYPNRMPNEGLSWSTTTTKNLGLDFNLVKGRIFGSVDVYKSMTTDQLLTRTIPILNGFSTVRTNVGRVDNQGIELVLTGIPVKGMSSKQLNWETSVVFSKNKNKLVDLYGTKDEQGNPRNDISGAPTTDAYLIGKSIHSVWDFKMIGIVQKDDLDYITTYKAKPGDVKFLDYNKDGKLNSSDYHYQGDRDPLFVLNFNNTFTYNNFSLYFSFKWNAGNGSSYLGKDRFGRMASMAIANGAQLKNVIPWTAENPNNEFPRAEWVNSQGYWFWNTRAFAKLKDLTLSYTFDKVALDKVKLQNVRLFASGNNLFTISDWTGLDPEDGGTIAANPGSIFYGSYPVLRTFSFGAVVSF
ncbi:MAG: SusC/RagA family TonB-linked outer membrane protein [Gammaproteobacteria bacterium]|nr:MAG: SusC/RagA family TonB-linked outer membrane protein [Gammaproteobacteria bacterium]